MARFLYEFAKRMWPEVVAVRVSETPKTWAEYQTGQGSVVSQIYGVLLRAVEQERKIKELEEFEARIEGLEQAQKQGGGSRRWRT